MTRVYLADSRPEERSALRYLLQDLNLKVVGESGDWTTTLAQAPVSRIAMLVVDWDILPVAQFEAIEEIRAACPGEITIVLISHLEIRQQAALSAGADAFISKSETPERVIEHLRSAAANISVEMKLSG
ncbi:MAG TPA: response regulator [Anaerolineales bacterium]|nr:response regulator [Anaerolineales bacterium]